MIVEENSTSFERELIPEGIHPAIVHSIVDIGEHESPYKNDDGSTRVKHQVVITLELPTIEIEIDGEKKPKRTSKFFTLSWHEKSAMRKMLSPWVGDCPKFDLKELLGMPCQVFVAHTTKDDKTYDNIEKFMKPTSAQDAYSLSEEAFIFDLADPATESNFERIPKWLQDKVNRPEVKF